MAETMVVVSALCLLVSLLFPVLVRSKAAAKRAVCAANLASDGKAIALYMNDSDDRYPVGKDAVDEFAPGPFSPSAALRVAHAPQLGDLLRRYAGGSETFFCPQDSGVRVVESQFPRPVALSSSVAKVFATSYEYRTDLGLSGMTGTGLREPSAVSVLNDLGGHWHGSAPIATPEDSRDDYRSKTLDYRYNVLFADLHLRFLTWREKEEGWRRG